MKTKITALLTVLAAILLATRGQYLESFVVLWGGITCLTFATPVLGVATSWGTVHLYGISGSISNATVTDFKLDEVPAIDDSTVDENGIRIEGRLDDLTKTGTITIRIRSGYTIPSPGTVLTYETVVYEVTKVGRTQTSKGFRTVELSIRRSSAVTPS